MGSVEGPFDMRVPELQGRPLPCGVQFSAVFGCWAEEATGTDKEGFAQPMRSKDRVAREFMALARLLLKFQTLTVSCNKEGHDS